MSTQDRDPKRQSEVKENPLIYRQSLDAKPKLILTENKTQRIEKAQNFEEDDDEEIRRDLPNPQDHRLQTQSDGG